MRLVEERFTRDELYIADEAFFTGTAAEITPIREVDNRKIGAGKPGPVTQKSCSRRSSISSMAGTKNTRHGWRR